MKYLLFIHLVFLSSVIGVNNSMFEFLIKTTNENLVTKINKHNRSITFNANYTPKINTFYTKKRFIPSNKEIVNLEEKISDLYSESQKLKINESLTFSKDISQKRIKKLKRKYLKIIQSESKKIMNYNKFYFGFINTKGERCIFIEIIDFSSLKSETITELKKDSEKVLNLLFTSEWNSYGGIVRDNLVYNLNSKKISSFGISSRITRFSRVECGTYE